MNKSLFYIEGRTAEGKTARLGWEYDITNAVRTMNRFLNAEINVSADANKDMRRIYKFVRIRHRGITLGRRNNYTGLGF